MVTLVLLQSIVPLEPAFAVGGVLSTVTVTSSVAVHPLTPVTVKV